MTDPTPALTLALTAPVVPHASLAAFRARHAAVVASLPAGAPPVDAAIAAGAVADRLGYAFAGGYAAALRALIPGGADCLSVTEAGGAHPRAIQATLSPADGGWRLTGEKAWATLADPTGTLAVVATTGSADGRPALRVARVRGDAPGVTLTRMPETPFTPEITHYTVSLADVDVPDAALLPGDGYAAYVKPFRTVEDAHVGAGALAYLLATGRRADWPEPLTSRMAALLLAYREVALADVRAPAIHVALAGCQHALAALLDAAAPHWAAVEPDVAARWHRDAPLLRIAARAREQRLQAALAALGAPGAPEAP